MSETPPSADSAREPESTQTEQPAPAKPAKRSWLRIPFYILLLVFLGLLLVVVWILGTQSGLRFALSLADELAPGLLHVEQANGRILGDLHLSDVSVQTPGLQVELGNLDLGWKPLGVFTGDLRISELNVRGLDVATAPSAEEAEASGPFELPQVVLPVQIELEQVLVEDLSIGSLDQDTRFRIDRIALAASMTGGEVTLKELAVALPEPLVKAHAHGKAELSGDYPLALGLTWSLSQEPALKLEGKAKVGGDLKALQVQHEVTGSAQAELQALVSNVLDDPSWKGKLKILGVDLPSFKADLPEVNLTGELTTNGDLEKAQLEGNLAGQAPELLDVSLVKTTLDATWQAQVLHIATLYITEEKSGALLTAGGDLDLSDPTIRLDLQAAWEKLRWPLAGTPLAESRQGKLDVGGTLADLRYQMSAEVWGPDFPEGKLSLTGRASQEATEIDGLRIDTLDGKIETKGRVAWKPSLNWDLGLSADGIDPSAKWPEWKGALGGRIQSKGKLKDEGPVASVQIESLKGELRGYPVDARGRMQLQGTEVQIDELRLASGPSDLRASGSVGEELNLEFGVSSPDLKSLYPGAQGSIKASGTLSGTLQAPAVKLGLSANGAAVAGQQIQDLKGTVDVDLAKGGPIKIDLKGQGLVLGDMAFDSLRVDGDGDMRSHRLTAKLTGKPLALDLNAAGGLKDDNAYSGRLDGLELRTQEFGTWRLQKPAPVGFAGPRISAGPICIREMGGSGGCVDFAQQEPGAWRASLDLDRLAFAMLQAFLPDGTALEGEARAKADFTAAGGMLTGNASVQVPKGVLTAVGGGETLQLVDFSATNLGVDAGAKGLQAKLRVPMKSLGDLSGDVSLPGWSLQTPARPEQSLRGGVRAQIKDLEIITEFVPDVRNLTGNIDADIKLDGSLGKPNIGGFVSLANGGLEVPFIGLKISDLGFEADARRDRVDYSGGLNAGKGRLELSGQTLITAAGPVTRIGAKGKRLILANSKEYYLRASADIQVEVKPTGTSLTGTVTVPEARIRPRSIPAGSVSPSPDVAVVSGAQDEQQEQSAYAMSIDLRAVLGKKVNVNAFGLDGSIKGELSVLQAPGKEILGDGELKIIDGTYRISTGNKLTAAIGKPLTITQGFLTYAKSPINNPYLVLTAERQGSDVTAAVRVSGTIKNPKMTFFSGTDPGMSQSEVTTYLLTGVPPRGSGGSADRSLSLGTYVAPDLFVEYENSLGDEPDKVKLRYDVNNRIQLQTETGDAQGADIFFKFEN